MARNLSWVTDLLSTKNALQATAATALRGAEARKRITTAVTIQHHANIFFNVELRNGWHRWTLSRQTIYDCLIEKVLWSSGFKTS